MHDQVLSCQYSFLLAVSLLFQEAEVVQKKVDVHLRHFECLVQAIARLNCDFLLTAKQFDLVHDPLPVHLGPFNLLEQPVVYLLFFPELFLHLSRHDALDIITATRCFLQVSRKFDFLYQQITLLTVH